MGTSGGASIALLMAILYPGLVRCVIADSTVEFFPAPSLGQEVQDRLQNTPEQVQFWEWAQLRKTLTDSPELSFAKGVKWKIL